MIAIDGVLVSDEVVEAQFVCDLVKCKGGCCVDGDCGAPLTTEEAQKLDEIYPKVKPYLDPEFDAEIQRQGRYVIDAEYGPVTPTVNGGICAYGYYDDSGVVKCGIEKAWQEGVVDFRKPVSCHLFPIRVTTTQGYEAVNYEPRRQLCRPACKLGKKLRVPVYRFLKEAIIRKWGEPFYEALDAAANRNA